MFPAFLAINTYLICNHVTNLVDKASLRKRITAKSSAIAGLTMTIVTIITVAYGVAVPGALIGFGTLG